MWQYINIFTKCLCIRCGMRLLCVDFDRVLFSISICIGMHVHCVMSYLRLSTVVNEIKKVYFSEGKS